ncbi:CRISPR-associated protein Cas5 family [mine drainage metagenome]|uniref:CRISPR-associated protein Cas5 family n=1 Tax=mine drainage metagenome TaxID=410659 RepID=T1BAC0_9ZZZZ
MDEVRVMKPIRTQTKGTKPLNFGGVFPHKRDPAKKEEPINTLAIYTFLADVEYQVRAHFEWNEHQSGLADDRIDGKHFAIARRMLELGGRQDIFLGTRDCQGYVEPCEFGSGAGHYDSIDRMDYGLTFHGFDYPDETGEAVLSARFWRPVMEFGHVRFPRPEACDIRKAIRPMTAKRFGKGKLRSVEAEASELGV